MRGKRWLLWLGVPVVALAALALTFSWDWVTPTVQRQASGLLGRQITIGSMHVSPGRVTVVTLRNVRIENPPDFRAEAPFAIIETLVLRLDGVASLRGRTAVINEIDVDGARVEAASLADNSNNFTFAVAAGAPPVEGQASPPPFRSLVIRNSHAHVVHAALRADFQGEIATREQEGRQEIVLNLRGTYANQPLTGEIVGGSILDFQNAERPWPIDARIQNGQTRGRLVGHLRNPLALAGADVRLELAGPDMALLRPLTGVPIPRTARYQVTGKLDYGDDRFRFTEMTGQVGNTDLAGTLTIDPRGAKPNVTADLRSRRVDMADLAGFIGGTPGRGATDGDNRVLPNQPLNVPAFQAANINLRYRAAQVSGRDAPIDNLDATLDLVDGVVRLHPLRAGMGRGEIVGDFTLTPGANGVHAVADARFTQMDISRLLRAVGGRGGGLLNGRARLDGTGRTTAEILARGNGAVTFGTAGGNLSAFMTDLAGLRLGNAVASAFGIPSRTNLECFVADFALQNGVLNTRALLLETEDATILGSGTIRLSDERLDLRLRSQAKHFTVASLPTSLGVSGTFSNPSVFPVIIERDATSSFGQLLNVLRAPLSLLPIVEFGIGEDARCENILNRAQPQRPTDPRPAPNRRAAPQRPR